MKKALQICLFVSFIMMATAVLAKDYIIYSIVQGIPMGNEKEEVKKNYYVNLGIKQGVTKGNVLDVYRIISRLDPYKTKKRYNYKVKIGELQVIHTEENTAITQLKSLEDENYTPLFEIENFMIGDKVGVKVN